MWHRSKDTTSKTAHRSLNNFDRRRCCTRVAQVRSVTFPQRIWNKILNFPDLLCLPCTPCSRLIPEPLLCLPDIPHNLPQFDTALHYSRGSQPRFQCISQVSKRCIDRPRLWPRILVGTWHMFWWHFLEQTIQMHKWYRQGNPWM